MSYYLFSGGLDYGAAVGEAQPVGVLAACGLVEACRIFFFFFIDGTREARIDGALRDMACGRPPFVVF